MFVFLNNSFQHILKNELECPWTCNIYICVIFTVIHFVTNDMHNLHQII